jgi:CDGSH-type Zn-finger protein
MSKPVIAGKRPIVLDESPGVKAWCACGRSGNQPYCDGSHQGTGLSPVRTEITEARKVAWCACKHTRSAPFCDGSHSRL